ncbi:MAG: DUF1343 domain-containing protein [Armatimonadetes bacterium]|nr:DUF1343 domain-containing protein [Armatimonadota bacterium]
MQRFDDRDLGLAPRRATVSAVRTGLDVLLRDGHPLLKGKRVGLLCNQASVDASLEYAHDALVARTDFTVAALFGPQHGLWGTTQDNMIEWEGGRDERLDVPVHSLYGAHRKPPAGWLEGLEVMVIDLLDIGARYYTFLWTATYVLEACAEAGIPVLVLDRPNPINGVDVEGPPHDAEYASFVGRFSLPVRHGLTMGELLGMLNRTHALGCDLTVLQMEGWTRAMWFDQTGLPWSMPSPNMPTLDTAVIYPGFCLFEGTMVSEGRGTTRPFEIVGAPWVEPYALAAAMEREGLAGAYFRPLFFEPTFQKHARETCGGVFVHVTDRNAFRSVHVAVALLHHLRRLYPGQFQWKQPPYEYEAVKMPFDILAGGDTLRHQIEAGIPPFDIAAGWSAAEDAFRASRQEYLLYS